MALKVIQNNAISNVIVVIARKRQMRKRREEDGWYWWQCLYEWDSADIVGPVCEAVLLAVQWKRVTSDFREDTVDVSQFATEELVPHLILGFTVVRPRRERNGTAPLTRNDRPGGGRQRQRTDFVLFHHRRTYVSSATQPHSTADDWQTFHMLLKTAALQRLTWFTL